MSIHKCRLTNVDSQMSILKCRLINVDSQNVDSVMSPEAPLANDMIGKDHYIIYNLLQVRLQIKHKV